MRDIYVKTHESWKVGMPAVITEPAAAGLHRDDKLAGFSVTRIKDVPESVGDALAVFTFNQCAVLGHTVEWRQLAKGHVVRGEGLAWDRVLIDTIKGEIL